MSVFVHAAHHSDWLGKPPPSSSFNRNWFNGRGRSKQINPTFKNSTGGTPSQEPNKKNPPPSLRMHLPDTACQPQPRIPPPPCQEKSSAGANVRLPRPAQMRSRIRGRKPDVRIHCKSQHYSVQNDAQQWQPCPRYEPGGGGPDGNAASREAEKSAWEKGSGDGKSRLLQRRNVSRWLKARSAQHDVKSAAGSEQPGGADGNKIFHYWGENIW